MLVAVNKIIFSLIIFLVPQLLLASAHQSNKHSHKEKAIVKKHVAAKSKVHLQADTAQPAKPISKTYRNFKFNQITITAPVNVSIRGSASKSLVWIKGTPDELEHINIVVKNNELRITSHRTFLFNRDDQIQIKIAVPQLSKLTLAGAAKAEAYNINSKNLQVVIQNNAELMVSGKNIGLKYLEDVSLDDVAIKNIKTSSLYVNAGNHGDLNLSGNIALRKFDYYGTGDVRMQQLQRAPLDIDFNGSGAVDLIGEMDLHQLDFNGNGKLQAYWIGSPKIYINGNGRGLIALAGMAKQLEANLRDHVILDARFVRTQIAAVKANDSSIAYVSPTQNLYSFATGRGHIYVMTAPNYFSERVIQSASVLPTYQVPDNLVNFYQPKHIYD